MSATRLSVGQNVRVRGLRALVTGISPSSVDADCARIDLRIVTGELQGDSLSVFSPIDRIDPEEVPPLQIKHLASLALWNRYHDAYRLELAAPPDTLTANPQAQIAIDEYQMVPARKLLSLPRPRLLIADDVGLGKTVEAGIAYLELARRRLAKRVLIVTPAAIREQWRKELLEKFGIEFDIFDRETVDSYRRQAEIGANPWLLRPRIIVSIDAAKMDGTFSELRRTSWDLAIIDEAHHVTEKDDDELTRNRVFARWLAANTRGLMLLSATPHDGNDETFASLLRLLEPRIAIQGALEQPVVGEYVVRRLKRDIRNPDGSPKFVPREPVKALPVTLTDEERALNLAVLETVRAIKNQSKRASGEVRTRIDFLATILRKRLASSRAALGRTLETRRQTLSENLEELKSRRDLLRRSRASEPLSDAEQAQLERELHAATIDSARRTLSRAAKATSLEDEHFLRLQELCDAISAKPESKVATLMKHLEEVWAEAPMENVILFTEYRDTAESLAADDGPLRERFNGRVMLLHGDVGDRSAVLAAFSQGDGKVLVTTDVASEGLNLQERCRSIVHYDLPWNPNRLEQRNGRVDRYGQKRSPRIAFLYAKDTYDGEVLQLLVKKIEKQIAALGSVGDVLGALQPRAVESLLDDVVENITAENEESITERIDQLVERASLPTALQKLESTHVSLATKKQPDLGRFVFAAIDLSGGRAKLGDGIITVERYPSGWEQDVSISRYALPGGPSDLPLLTLQTPLARAAINAIRELRYDSLSDPRAAVRTHGKVDCPVLLGSFMISVRSKDGFVEERLTVLGVREDGTSEAAPERLLSDDRWPEPPQLPERAREIFEQWWTEAHKRLLHEAQTMASDLSDEIANERQRGLTKHRSALNDWYAAEKHATLRGSDERPMFLFGDSATPAQQRELDRLEAERQRQLDDLNMHAELEAPVCEPLGVLLVLPSQT